MTTTGPAITLQVRDYDEVLEFCRLIHEYGGPSAFAEIRPVFRMTSRTFHGLTRCR
jgi:hypothetical protein